MKHILIVILAVLGTLQVTQASEQVGHAVFTRGTTTAQLPSGDIRFLGANAPLFEGDTLTTGKKSFAVIKLDDGTRMSLRPDTVFRLQQFDTKKNNAVMRLFKGGFRALTGFISKRNPNGFNLRASTATIGIRGTEFDVRMCGNDCQKEAVKYAKRKAQEALVVGRVAFMKGSLSITKNGQHERNAVTGAPLYEGDKLVTGTNSFAVLAFRDEGRITLQSETEFAIENLKFNKKYPDQGNALFKLVRGGIRAFTGLIGKRNNKAYKMVTPVATIGIRGTGFDLVCQGACVEENVTTQTDIPSSLLDSIINPANADLPQGNGLYAHVWDGKIVLELENGQLILDKGKTVFIRNKRSEPEQLPTTPLFIEKNPATRPDKVEIDFARLFGTVPFERYRPGLFVQVLDGHVSVDTDDGQHTDLGAGESASVDDEDGKLVRLEIVPPVLLEDPYFKTINEDFMDFYDLLGEGFDDDFECTIQ